MRLQIATYIEELLMNIGFFSEIRHSSLVQDMRFFNISSGTNREGNRGLPVL